jgi:DNA-binding MarR family transcriptional regulator
MQQVYPKQPSPCHCLNVRRASRAVSQFYERYLEPCGLTIPQLSLLLQLSTAERTTINELAERMRIDRTTLNRNMKPLADAGLITIRPGRDFRTRHIQLTKAGGEAVSQGRKLWREAQRALTEYLGEDDLKKLTALMSKLEALVP